MPKLLQLQKYLLIIGLISLVLACAKETPNVSTLGDNANTANSIGSSETPRRHDKSERSQHDTLPFFGELHVHSENSPDAYITGVRSTPEDAYRYAKGEAIAHISGQSIQNKAPIDFMAVTDHAEYLGILPALSDPNGPLAETWYGREALSGDHQRYQAATLKILYSLSGSPPKAIEEVSSPEITAPIWKSYVELAEKYNEPGIFTTFVAYEWTLIPNAQNLHRNIIFKGTEVPALPFSAFDSDKPEELWQWMEKIRQSGSDVLAIPHNSNVSDGLMFSLLDSWGKPIDQAYAKLRMRNEPIVEVSQIKGTSETHPILSPNDEWANFEILEELLGGERKGKINGSYVREAYLNGIKLEQEEGFNPFQFGMIAASDSHNSSVPVEEDNYSGKIGTDATAEQRRGGSFINTESSRYGAAGLAGVWAIENTRNELFDAMQRKEVFATSGPKIAIRLFAGDFPQSIPTTGLTSEQLYTQGVAMGGSINQKQLVDGQLTLYAWAGKDSNSYPLQRLQIIKGWYDQETLQEQVFDVACSDGLAPDPTNFRCADNMASVNLEDCSVNNGNIKNNSAQLATVWRDPTFNPDERAFYYARVLENPSCRWTTFDALRNNWKRLKSVPATLQERAWSSPIWYSPQT